MPALPPIIWGASADAPQGWAALPGLDATSIYYVRSASYSRMHGITPGVINVEMAPHAEFSATGGPVAGGNVTFWFGPSNYAVPNCLVRRVSARMTPEGQVWTVCLADRRWAWEYGQISGAYNQRLLDGTLDLETSLSPQALATLCLEAMGENGYDVSDLPNASRPQINWDVANPAKALQTLAESLGCRVVYQFTDDTVALRVKGVGAQLPLGALAPGTQDDAMSESASIKPPQRPDLLRVVCGPTRYQYDFLLEAVGLDTDGTVKPINDLSYAPGQTAQISTITIGGTIVAGQVFTVATAAGSVDATALPGDTAADIAADLATLLTALGTLIDFSVDGDVITCTGTQGQPFSLSGSATGSATLTIAQLQAPVYGFSDPDFFKDIPEKAFVDVPNPAAGSNQTATVDIGGVPAPGQVYGVTLNGITDNYTAQQGDSNQTIAIQLQALLSLTWGAGFDFLDAGPDSFVVVPTAAWPASPFTISGDASGSGSVTVITTPGTTATIQVEVLTGWRFLAQQTVFKWYRIKLQNRDSVKSNWGGGAASLSTTATDSDSPGSGTLVIAGQIITEMRQILPLEAQQIDAIIDFDGLRRPKPAQVYGTFLRAYGGYANTAPNTVYDEAHQIIPTQGVVVFGSEVTKYIQLADAGAVGPPPPGIGNTSAWVRVPADLCLRCAFSIKTLDTFTAGRYYADLVLGPPFYNTGAKILRHDDLVLNSVSRYDPTSGSLEARFNNSAAVQAEAQLYLTAAAVEYQPTGTQDATYAGLKWIELDGAIQQITWSVGPGGATTRACRNDEFDPLTPRYLERRFWEEAQGNPLHQLIFRELKEKQRAEQRADFKPLTI